MIEKYETWDEAHQAVIKLGVTTCKEYQQKNNQDPRLPANPDLKYAEVWASKGRWAGFLGNEVKNFYETWEEAHKAAMKHGLASRTEYRCGYKQDPRLPSNPHIRYADAWANNNSWFGFLGKEVKNLYETWEEASQAAIALGFRTGLEYQRGYKRDPNLPAQPNQKYADVWQEKGGFIGFLGRKKKDFYETWEEAHQAVLTLGLTTQKEYQQGYKQDPQLAANPDNKYADVWEDNGRWMGFLGNKPNRFYETWDHAHKAAVKLGFFGRIAYELGYKRDPLLHSRPEEKYSDVWDDNGGWAGFLGNEPKNLYKTWDEARQAAIKLGITTSTEYKLGYRQDPRLPGQPNNKYADVWNDNGGWYAFLGNKAKCFYETWEEAHQAAMSLGLTTQKEYRDGYKQNPRLPSNPHVRYTDVWEHNGGLLGFLMPRAITTYHLLMQAVKVLEIKNSIEYRKVRQTYKQLPSKPEQKFKSDWVDWYTLCDIPTPYLFEELNLKVLAADLSSKTDYKNWRVQQDDQRIPKSPEKVYSEQFKNWYIFLGKPEPYKTEYIIEEYDDWKNHILEHLATARGGGTKETSLCKFVRGFIIKNRLGVSVLDFLMNKDINRQNYRQFIDEFEPASTNNIDFAVNEFLDSFIKKHCADEDEDTGELIYLEGVRNRLSGIVEKKIANVKSDESKKSALAHCYVVETANWICPEEAKTFSDLINIQQFTADWVTVPDDLIDKNDPDCVFKKDQGQTKIWIPTYWLLLLVITTTPARGRQAAYVDSGEADAEVPEWGKITEWDDDKKVNITRDTVVWKKNSNKLAGQLKYQGFIKKYQNGSQTDFGMHFTSNKTSLNQTGYSVAWMPHKLAYWMIKLRRWQEKYNPIDRPSRWVELDRKRLNLNERQCKEKGANCFLFRDFRDYQCGHYSARLAHRLAAALYFTQPAQLTLATHAGEYSTLSHYKSTYTPHSMRVSLITAYVEEYDLPIQMIMKIAGHSSIVMNVYYTRIGNASMRSKLEKTEKVALLKQAEQAQHMIEQQRIDEIKPSLVGNSDEILRSISNKTPVGNYLFRDYGICPYAGSRCHDGGDFLEQQKAMRGPVASGYLGQQNCLRCRHFITGTAFLGGLLSVCNELLTQLTVFNNHRDDTYSKIESVKDGIEKEKEQESIADFEGHEYKNDSRIILDAKLRKAHSEYESVTMKMDVFYCDLNGAYRLIMQCQALLNNTPEVKTDEENPLQLIVQPGHELDVSPEEVSLFQQYSEVCENAEIYTSANADLVNIPRGQMLDKMMAQNGMNPHFFNLSPKSQLTIGNQMTALLRERLKSWERVDQLIDGSIQLEDLSDDEKITRLELTELAQPLLSVAKHHIENKG